MDFSLTFIWIDLVHEENIQVVNNVAQMEVLEKVILGTVKVVDKAIRGRRMVMVSAMYVLPGEITDSNIGGTEILKRIKKPTGDLIRNGISKVRVCSGIWNYGNPVIYCIVVVKVTV